MREKHTNPGGGEGVRGEKGMSDQKPYPDWFCAAAFDCAPFVYFRIPFTVYWIGKTRMRPGGLCIWVKEFNLGRWVWRQV
jgi:hypothetical protein